MLASLYSGPICAEKMMNVCNIELSFFIFELFASFWNGFMCIYTLNYVKLFTVN